MVIPFIYCETLKVEICLISGQAQSGGKFENLIEITIAKFENLLEITVGNI